MNEKFKPEVITRTLLTPINPRAREGNFSDSEIFGITDDLPIVLNLFRKEGLAIPDTGFVISLRGELVNLLGNYISKPPLYLH